MFLNRGLAKQQRGGKKILWRGPVSVSEVQKFNLHVNCTFLLQVLELVKGMHYQLACQKYFELTHNVSEVI